MSASPDRTIAGLVGDRYEITGLIASGGMGSVYRAHDTVLDRTVALKVLRTGDEGPGFVARFREEATNAARLSHANIVQIYDFGYSDGVPYMAMEYVDGQNLREVLGARGVLRPDVAARIASQVASALEHARRNGLVHRDIKPENILIATDGAVKVADFGLSRVLAESRASQSGVIYGTAAYLAPEQVEGKPVDHRADLYALGVVLFEMLTGKPPFTGDSPVVIAYKRVSEDVPSPMSINPSVPRELDAVVVRATARDPGARYPSAGMMLQALREVAPGDEPVEIGGLVHHTQAIPLTGMDTVVVQRRGPREGKRRNRRRRILALAAALTLIGTFVYAATTGPLSKEEVPRVLGLTQQDAKTRLERAGFRVDVLLANHPTVGAGLVISQDPASGASVRVGSTVTLQVSLGPEVLGVPDLRGRTYNEAERILERRGFEVVRVDEFHDTVRRLHVIAQNPDPGVLLQKGKQVRVVVSAGPELVKVPDVVGDPVASATDDLEALDFTVVVRKRIDEKVPKGKVISQSPGPGAEARKGSEVTLVVSKGPPLVAVPNLGCMTRRQAEDALASVGLRASFEGSGKRVVDQDPGPGTKIAKGSRVTVLMGQGAFC